MTALSYPAIDVGGHCHELLDAFTRHPGKDLRRRGAHIVRVVPNYADDLPAPAERMGADRLLFGSDRPHGEGREAAVSFVGALC
ncbi:hypothetical protein [Nocardia barduliensis]|uniref:hypothetical protein n=1 Tax=Nocardia barduliensis TaxID=2736643 RepID=UPI0015724BE4|nr:hypothetical protein [Nocardia barduliensis]